MCINVSCSAQTISAASYLDNCDDFTHITARDNPFLRAHLSLAAQNENAGSRTSRTRKLKPEDIDDITCVKIIALNQQNEILALRHKHTYLLPEGPVEWDDENPAAAARREVLEATNLTLGQVEQVTLITTKDHKENETKTLVFVGRVIGEDAPESGVKRKYRFLDKDKFLRTSGNQNDLTRALVTSAFKILVEGKRVIEFQR